MAVVGLAAALSSGGGCGMNAAVREDSERLTTIERLEDEVARLHAQISQKDQQLRQLADTVQNLRGLDGERTIDQLVHVESIQIERLSGGYDDNKDGVDDGVAVYLTPVDQFGGGLRASGFVRIKVLDLSAEPSQQVVGEVSLSRVELQKRWYGRLLTHHYTVKVPWAGGLSRPPSDHVTVLATFTDLLTGKTCEAQRVVKVVGVAAP